MLIDTHCHLDYLKQPLAEVFSQCSLAGVKKMISISVDGDNMILVKEMAQNYPQVYGTIGIHPHEASSWSEKIKLFFDSHHHHPKIVAFGEIGLDYFYMHSPKEKQIEVFEKQLDLAVQYQMPVIIHSREAEQDTMNVIKPYLSKIKNVVFHSFSSSLPLAEFALQEGCFLGFTGMITFKNADNVRAALALTPIEKLVIETDAPYLAPVPHRGKENISAYLPHIAQKIAELKKISISELESQLWQNSLKLFPKLNN